MYKVTLTYEDLNGDQRTEDFYFHLSRSAAIRWENSVDGGLSARMQRIVDSNSKPALMKLFEDVIMKTYGIKTEDGKRFEQSEEISTAFIQSPAYDALFMKLFTEDEYASTFINAIIPDVSDLKDKEQKS